jgi:cohesin complex subunit SCC1
LPDVENTYRILGLLLLGVVRIYSKKVEYLYSECDQLLEASAEGKKRVPKRAKKGACARRLVIDEEDPVIAKKPARSGRTSRAENGVMSQTLVQIPEGHEPLDLPPIFTIPKRFELDSFDLQIPENR